MKVDLHIHTTLSDGSYSIQEVVDMAYMAGLDAIAITDHDTMAQQKLIPRHSKIKVVAGVEISAVDKNTGITADVLGYGIKNSDLIEKLTLPMLKRRHRNSLRQIEALRNMGMNIDMLRLNKASGKYIYEPHIMEQLAETSQVDGMFGDFYNTVFKGGGPCDFDLERIDVRDAISTVKKAGGFAVLAHPGRQKNFYMIDDFPFDGIELNHPENSIIDKKTIRAYALKYDLFLTGGSDFHGKYDEKSGNFGHCFAPEYGWDFYVNRKIS